MFKKLTVFALAALATVLLSFAWLGTGTDHTDNSAASAPITFTPLPPADVSSWPLEQLWRSISRTGDLPDHINRTFVRVRVDTSQGSGFIYKSGYVITNAHVVMTENGEVRPGRIEVTLRNRTHTARLVAYSPTYDMAVLSISTFVGEAAPIATVPPLVGDPLVAVGNPSSGSWVARGNVLSTTTTISHRFNTRHAARPVPVLVYDARVVKGYSGGPTMNANGEVVGLTVGLVNGWFNPETNRMERTETQVAVAYPIALIVAEAERLLASTR